MEMQDVTGVKVFSETMARPRSEMGQKVTDWFEGKRAESSEFEVYDMIVRQSSDAEFHCLSIVILYRG